MNSLYLDHVSLRHASFSKSFREIITVLVMQYFFIIESEIFVITNIVLMSS